MKLRIKSFKSIKKVEINVKKVNIFIGPPGSGKSNILEALGLIRGLYKGSLEGFVRFSRIEDLFFKRIPTKIEIEMDDEKIELDIEKIKKRKFETRIGKEIRFYRFDREKMIMQTPRKISYLNDPYGENLGEIILLYEEEIAEKIVEDLGKIGIIPRVDPVTKRLEFELKTKDLIRVVKIPLELVSDGVLNYLLNLLAIRYSGGRIICIEEPETRTFPYFIESICEEIKNSEKIFFITTHNPYFMTSILSKVSIDELSINIVYLDGIETKVKQVEVLEKWKDIILDYEQFL